MHLIEAEEARLRAIMQRKEKHRLELRNERGFEWKKRSASRRYKAKMKALEDEARRLEEEARLEEERQQAELEAERKREAERIEAEMRAQMESLQGANTNDIAQAEALAEARRGI